ncbi:MAG TPA: DUF6701 domain-containing protein, partial [Burkholderiales bacterium]|nr:DUF6701 domain-containing protein [Burkholderiales bacterium]
YPDAGSVSLFAQYALPSPPASTFLSGSSNTFVVRPFGFAFRGASSTTTVQHGTSATATKLAAAGANFTMTLGAYRWAAGEDTDSDGVPDAGVDITNNGLTSNFAAAVTVAASANLPGIATGAISRGATCASAASIAAASFSGGAATITDWCYGEVGNVFLTATASNYITSGITVTGNSGMDGTGTAGGYVGRFVPDNFAVSLNTPQFAASCNAGAFTYVGQSFAYSTAAGMLPEITVTARNRLNATTSNYVGAYMKFSNATGTSLNQAPYDTQSGRYARFDALGGGTTPVLTVSPSSVSGDPTIGTFTAGVGKLTFGSGFAFSFARSSTTPSAPFNADIGLAINVIDSDGVAYAGNPATFGAATLNGGISFGGATADAMRYGRMRLNNSYGSALLDLPQALSVEYYNAGGFQLNTDDSCTTLVASNIRMSAVTGNTDLSVGCKTGLSPAGTIPFNGGKASSTASPSAFSPLKLTKPGSGNNGSVNLTVNLDGTSTGNTCAPGSTAVTSAALPWLLGNWGSSTYSANPAGIATFGVFKSADEFIYLREVY